MANEIRKLTHTVAEIDAAVDKTSNIGDLSQLETTDKSTIVGAINELVEGSGGFQPTPTQLTAINSGITSELVTMISTNNNDIAEIQENIESLNTAVSVIPNLVEKETGKGLSTNDFTNGEKAKLSGIEDGANKTVVDATLNSTSSNPLQNKAVYNALFNKVDKVTGKGLSTNDYTDEEKQKLSNIEEGANKTIVDVALSSTSSNPLQNKAIYDEFQNKVDKITGKGLSTNDFTTALRDFLASLKDGIYLELNTNLDSVTETGMYLMNSAMINVPENVSGASITTALMLVLNLTSTRRVQIYIPAYQNTLINGCIYIREKLLDNSWTKWYEHGNGLGISIAENGSLDSISEAGHYYCPSATICGTLSGLPTDLSTTAVAFSLDTIHLVNVNTRTQLLYPGGNDNGGIIYKRNRYGGSWRPWFKFSGTQN